MKTSLSFEELSGRYAVCRLAPGEPVPAWVPSGGVVSCTRTHDELSIVCMEGSVPPDVQAERGWRGFRIRGALDFSLVGVLAEVAQCLADAGISLFCLSTYDTDYFLVKEDAFDRAKEHLVGRGHTFLD